MENHDCMIQRCNKCPGFEPVLKFLESKIEDLDEIINSKQWVSVDQTDLITQSLPVLESIQLLINKLEDLASHYYISHAQSTYLKNRKQEINQQTALILMDFAENYAFHVQDEARDYHWTHQNCTVHPVVCYYKSADNNNLPQLNLCFLSEELQHDSVMVYLIQSKTIEVLIPNLKTSILTMDALLNTRTESSFIIYASTKLILALMLLGLFLPPAMANHHVMGLVAL